MALRIKFHSLRTSKFLVAAIAAGVLAACAMQRPARMEMPPLPVPLPMPPVPMPTPMPTPVPLPLRLESAPFSALEGWSSGDPRDALQAFQRSCAVLAGKADDAVLGGMNYAGSVADWREACASASMLSEITPESARAYFEMEFVPYRLSQGSGPGLFTGYYEPELKGSRTQHDSYQTPLYGVPADLVNVDLGLFRENLRGQRLVGRVTGNRLVPYAARSEIVGSGLKDAKPLFYVDDAVDAFFLQIQGSGRIVLDDGSVVRAAYAAQNGLPYTAIGAVLIQRGELMREEVSLQTIRAWLMHHPAEAQQLMNANASYVFFNEQPIGDPTLGATGAEGVPLTPEASLAVDLSIHPMGVPLWLEASAPEADASKPERAFERLFIAQDTGGAIRGAIRGDVYWGYGADAASIAGRMRSEGRLTVLLPKAVAAQLGARAEFAAQP